MSLSRWLSITSKNTCVSRGPDILVIHISSASHFARAASVHSALLDPQGGLSLLMNMHGKNWFCGRQDGCPNQKDTAYPLLIGFGKPRLVSAAELQMTQHPPLHRRRTAARNSSALLNLPVRSEFVVLKITIWYLSHSPSLTSNIHTAGTISKLIERQWHFHCVTTRIEARHDRYYAWAQKGCWGLWNCINVCTYVKLWLTNCWIIRLS